MKRIINLFVFISLLALAFSNLEVIPAQAKPFYALGMYPNTSVVLGENTTVTPSAAPTGTTSINVSTDTNFKGTFVANTTTGVVRVINAHPAGTYTVTVRAFGSSLATTTFILTVTNGVACAATPGFSAPTNYAMGSQPFSVAVADFNNDGNQDLVTPNNGSNNASVRLGNGAGGFGAATNFTVGVRPGIVAVGDFNNDGNQDFATANENVTSPGNVSVLLGTGGGGFGAVTNFTVGGARPWSIAVGDFNNDGRRDLVTANYSNNNVSILLGDGAGAFGAATNLAVGTGPWSVAVGDFNNDGNQDLVTANVNANSISLLLGNGAGGFGAATNLTVGTAPRSVAVGDFNNDGNQDLAVANANSNNVSIRLGNGAGGFGAATNLVVGTGPWSVAVGDFNNDGNQDFVTANWASNNVTIRLGNGVGGFSAATNFNSGGTQTVAVAVGDFNNNTKQDLAVANRGSNNVTIFLGYLPLCYDGNGNTGGTAPVDGSSPYAPGASVTVLGNTGSLVRSGYTFNGWNTAADGSGTSYAPTATFNITAPTILYAQWTALGNALSFDGNDTLQTAATIFSTSVCNQPYTIELWLRTTADAGALVTQYGSLDPNRFGLRLYLGNVRWWHGSGASITSNDTVVNDGQWHHVVATRNSGGTVNFYIDGNLDSASGSDTACFENAVVRFGSFDPGNTSYAGEMDDIRIWDVARTQSQIQANMFHEFTSAEAAGEVNLIGYWPLNEGSGQTTADLSSGSHTATLGTTAGVDTSDPTWQVSTAPMGDAVVYAQTGIAGFWASANPASSGGLIFTNNSFLNDIGDDIIFGHNNVNDKTVDDVPTTGLWIGASDPMRWNRTWYCDLNDQNNNGGTVDITFDFTAAGMGAGGGTCCSGQ